MRGVPRKKRAKVSQSLAEQVPQQGPKGDSPKEKVLRGRTNARLVLINQMRSDRVADAVLWQQRGRLLRAAVGPLW